MSAVSFTAPGSLVASLQISEELRDAGFCQPLREQWIAAAQSDKIRAVEARLAELPEGWRLAVSEGEMTRGEDPGKWSLTFQFIAIDPACPDPLPVPATPQRWTLYGPNRRDNPDAV